ncbi:hypothetical protein V9T40_010626 [Parthenolecanium corni]|uniref:Uncharacterized protein n=1 Tax=Parthenolecanium corni TaxID=536013 RepID=A0AAN9T4I5_9HEMI
METLDGALLVAALWATLAAVAASLLRRLLGHWRNTRRLGRALRHFQSPPCLPIIGNIHLVFGNGRVRRRFPIELPDAATKSTKSRLRSPRRRRPSPAAENRRPKNVAKAEAAEWRGSTTRRCGRPSQRLRLVFSAPFGHDATTDGRDKWTVPARKKNCTAISASP